MAGITSCNCCQGLSPETPVALFNRPGLNAIAYRAGTYDQFRESLLTGLSNAQLPALQKLTSRSTDDFTIALLDAWAVVSDVLTFYQERIANESYLRTATERLSVLQMARHTGYELRPGVAATTYLAFTLEDISATPLQLPNAANGAEQLSDVLALEPGVKVQSVPGPDEQPQTFETVEPILTRAAWNTIRPRLMHRQEIRLNNGFFIIDDSNADIKKGDVLLITEKNERYLRKILQVEIDKNAKTTTVYFSAQHALPRFNEPVPFADGTISMLAGKTMLDDEVVSEILKHTWREEDLALLAESKQWRVKDMADSIRRALRIAEDPATGVYVFRKTASPFGYNALKQITYSSRNRMPEPAHKWIEWDLEEACGIIYLDSEYKEVVPGSFVGVQQFRQGLHEAKVYKIESADAGSRSAYGMNAKATSLTISKQSEECWFSKKMVPQDLSVIRGVNLYVQSEPLPLAATPIEESIKGEFITLDNWYPGLKKGQRMIVTGERIDLRGTMISEVMEVKEIFVKRGYSVVRFTQELSNAYVRNSVTINGNVALATHGETVKETLGSGNGAASFQRFVLRQPPLTYTSASSPTGVASTLRIFINDIEWHEVESFHGHTAEERIFITRLDNEGKTSVIFGDGITGLRTPTGAENIKATYRKGIGLGGLVKANQLSQLLTRPLGVKAAVNPVASNGAADRETLAAARSNAPLTLLALGRIVSLQDYEDFTRAFPGIEKSLATWTWQNQRRVIYLTVAGVNGAALSKRDVLYQNLVKAIGGAQGLPVPFVVESYKPLFFRLSAYIKVHPDHQPDKVLLAAEQALRDAFSFTARSFGQPVSLSEVIATCQQVNGVVAVDIDHLYYSHKPISRSPWLSASAPVTGEEAVLPAELLILDAATVDLKLLP